MQEVRSVENISSVFQGAKDRGVNAKSYPPTKHLGGLQYVFKPQQVRSIKFIKGAPMQQGISESTQKVSEGKNEKR